jgi:mevalonate pyrophosphate decarboxylase
MLPLNDSISVNIDELFATTKVVLGPHIKEDEIIVNGKKLEKKDRFKRLFHVIP